MLPHVGARQAAPEPGRHTDSLHSDADEGNPQPKGACEDTGRRPAHPQALPGQEG